MRALRYLFGGSAGSENKSLSYHRSDAFLVVEPDLEAEANLTRHVRLTRGALTRL